MTLRMISFGGNVIFIPQMLCLIIIIYFTVDSHVTVLISRVFLIQWWFCTEEYPQLGLKKVRGVLISGVSILRGSTVYI